MSICDKKADMYRVVQACAEQMPFPVPLPKIRRTHFGTTIAKNQHMWWRDGTTLYSAYLMEILDETILRMEVYEADECLAAHSIQIPEEYLRAKGLLWPFPTSVSCPPPPPLPKRRK